MANEGYRGGITLSLPIAMTIAGFFAVSIYNVIEINIAIFLTFKRRRGLYFWSLLVASWGIPVHAVAFLLKFFQICRNNYFNVALITVGWFAMVTGQSIVMYSRLHLVVQDRKKIRWVLIMIIVDIFLFHIPPTVLNFGANSSNPKPFLEPFAVYEKIQITAFSTQELIISCLYIWETRQMLRVIASIRAEKTRRVMTHLIFVNVLIILMDMTLLGTEYANQYHIETTYKSTLYSVKLKMEFAVLNQLRSIVRKQPSVTDAGTFIKYYSSSGKEPRSCPDMEPSARLPSFVGPNFASTLSSDNSSKTMTVTMSTAQKVPANKSQEWMINDAGKLAACNERASASKDPNTKEGENLSKGFLEWVQEEGESKSNT
ncbi:hypothetical protein MPH_13710 [Macrophomina phaseolina MS6]|uniref:DUF7703 domain-containing protein n=1 Tax=Macrophomina phaseolina (strain MS6) TaxID=1126212 RepID=K2RGP4_MACPH|nr:hypothetical protein MPH_13710 [Macrophomina phaseolina MS6]